MINLKDSYCITTPGTMILVNVRSWVLKSDNLNSYFWLLHLLAVWLWPIYLPSLIPSLVILIMEIRPLTHKDKTELNNIKEAQYLAQFPVANH